ncbi:MULTISPECIES: aa3-type cytochrome oxidase subunit CtaJ [Mycolicibacterium]|uniref:Uncharacterized protein n=1 Tax=Mycolicibacterium mageritense TaxID=53462 RepID=A0ABN5YKK9_MYCME|nr:hypothetical protein [Mycolicibacterium mageritense]MBN3454024.1 hypothetical protein [Mycobacterium sp. DSM 3803]MCC9182226.1 hypothetical protein [Mycolicibacterium mageritense]TXI53557.1 MAG: hypothetical protein E6Q55_34940 [Mycolicibacterium mageritense]BBX38465.1 hypothetical protein MMAGJ_77470 [Mycolicibacterium mageritense]GJJ19880.1 hypothetical protein MTY414_35530 [Mycolicibacterium mageritense]
MSTALTHSLLGGVPLVLFVVLALIYLTRKGPHPDTYKMSDPWTHEPILWAAEEPADHGHGGHDSHGVTIGGGASGKW